YCRLPHGLLLAPDLRHLYTNQNGIGVYRFNLSTESPTEGGEMVANVDELVIANEGPPLSKEELDELIIRAQNKLAEKHQRM
ncbi:unnamed protein product, partial [Ectocarpus fasciculatus]